MTAQHHTPHWQPGLLALHGNQTEALLDAVAAWLQAQPLAPLEPQIILVHSNAMAEWLKMQLAQRLGVCAAVQVELPARFLWRSYRQILGRAAVPSSSALDKEPLLWRLLRLLPEWVTQPVFAPLEQFLRPGEPQRLLQLAQRLADLFDQYQNYRSDWLADWQAGRAQLQGPGGLAAQPLPPEQLWQPALWQALLADLPQAQRYSSRAAVSSRALAQLQSGAAPQQSLARRVVVFGINQLPLTTLQLLAAMAQHSQVLLAVPNPCRYHWADAIDGRELLRQQRRRQPLRQGRDLASIPLEAMHAHAHPLLLAWGRQSRDFVRQLDAFDDSTATAPLWQLSRVDLFDEAPPEQGTLLQQVQRSMRDLLPLAEHPQTSIPTSDNSIVFHSTHSLVRELEVLHDQLLGWLAAPAAPDTAALQPRDIVVMLPDVQAAAPHIRAVFGQYPRSDARHIPFDIADLSARLTSPLVLALQWLLDVAQQRWELPALCDFLEVPAVAARFGLQGDDAAQLAHWMQGAGIRWGLDAQQRADIGLAACGAHNSAQFGLERMLLGYTSGSGARFDDIQAYGEVGGLNAELAGVLATLLARLQHWWQLSQASASPSQWADRLRQLLAQLFLAQDDTERAVLDALDSALEQWLSACELADFDQAVPLAVAQAAWLGALEQPSLEQRFRAHGVTFCTLMPMRAIPFEVVCLLGMNDGDYPRRAVRSDFDLMQWPGQYRPGDRARGGDDRQLMLDALLSARQRLYISWAGRSVRDNSHQPPSVLIAQLRDYLAKGWRGAGAGAADILAERTWEHPLQPFSRSYFEADSALHTYAQEWRAAHSGETTAETTAEDTTESAATALAFSPNEQTPLTLAQLSAFVRHPARAFMRQRLAVYFEDADLALEDHELFELSGINGYSLVQQLQQHTSTAYTQQNNEENRLNPSSSLRQQLQNLQRSGALPLGGIGTHVAEKLHASILPGLQAWAQLRQRYHLEPERLALHYRWGDVLVQDWLEGVLRPSADAQAAPHWLALDPRDVADDKQQPQPSKLLPTYLRSLVAAACSVPVAGWLVGRDLVLHIPAMEPTSARQQLDALLALWLEGQASPLPLPRDTGLALARDKPEQAWEAYMGKYQRDGEVADPYWARLYPDYTSLAADGRLESAAQQVYQPLLAWCESDVQVYRWEELPGAA